MQREWTVARVGCRVRMLSIHPDLQGGSEAVYQALLSTIRNVVNLVLLDEVLGGDRSGGNSLEQICHHS